MVNARKLPLSGTRNTTMARTSISRKLIMPMAT